MYCAKNVKTITNERELTLCMIPAECMYWNNKKNKMSE